MPNPFDERTFLSPDEERRFRHWARASGIRDLDHPDSFYDYRGYWKTLGDQLPHIPGMHFPDTFKQHGHPSFSQESQYSETPGDGGRWLPTLPGEEDKFVPPGADVLGTSRRDPREFQEMLRVLMRHLR